MPYSSPSVKACVDVKAVVGGLEMAISCQTCGTVLSGRQVFCDRNCWLDRPGSNPTHQLIKDLGGRDFVADKCDATARNVRQWYMQGIPRSQFARILRLAGEFKLNISLQWLEELSQAQRAQWQIERRRKQALPKIEEPRVEETQSTILETIQCP